MDHKHVALPIEPLLEALVVRYGCGDERLLDGVPFERTLNITHLARMTGVNAGSFHRWIRNGEIPVGSAGKLLALLDKHLLEVWPECHSDEEVLL